MKLISWNVNGLRACVTKGFMDFFNEMQADVFAVQETKLQPEQIQLDLPGYHQYWHSAQKKGYSSTAVFCKEQPLSVTYDIGSDHPLEGRVITLEFENFYFVNAYVPNSQEGLARLEYRMNWEKDMQDHLCQLNQVKPVIYTGDLNVAKEEIDLKNPKTNRKNAGFSDEERQAMRDLLAKGFVDSYRFLYPEKVEYSWWSYRFSARSKNVGWRIDYFLTSTSLQDKIQDSIIYTQVLGSDHCPIGLHINL